MRAGAAGWSIARAQRLRQPHRCAETHNRGMRNVNLTLPEFAFIVGTRAALGVGVGLLLSERIDPARRRGVGAALLAVGALTTIPALFAVFGRPRPAPVAADV